MSRVVEGSTISRNATQCSKIGFTFRLINSRANICGCHPPCAAVSMYTAVQLLRIAHAGVSTARFVSLEPSDEGRRLSQDGQAVGKRKNYTILVIR